MKIYPKIIYLKGFWYYLYLKTLYIDVFYKLRKYRHIVKHCVKLWLHQSLCSLGEEFFGCIFSSQPKKPYAMFIASLAWQRSWFAKNWLEDMTKIYLSGFAYQHAGCLLIAFISDATSQLRFYAFIGTGRLWNGLLSFFLFDYRFDIPQ